MSRSDLAWIANYIRGIADDVLRGLYVRGKYRDVILPMTLLPRLDAVLEDDRQAVLEMQARLDAAGVVEQDAALRQAAGQPFCNASPFTLRQLRARSNPQQLRADCEAWLDGFSPNVQDILDSFEFRNRIPRLAKGDALGALSEKLASPDINLSSGPVRKSCAKPSEGFTMRQGHWAARNLTSTGADIARATRSGASDGRGSRTFQAMMRGFP